MDVSFQFMDGTVHAQSIRTIHLSLGGMVRLCSEYVVHVCFLARISGRISKWNDVRDAMSGWNNRIYVFVCGEDTVARE